MIDNFTNEEIIMISNALIDRMHRFDEALTVCNGIPAARNAIESERKNLQELNLKILALYDTSKEQ